MAVANTKTPSVTARDATPNTLTNYRKAGLLDGGAVATLAADDDASVYRMCRVPSSGKFITTLTTNGTVTGGTDFDFGIYRTAADGGAVVVKDCIHDGIDMSTARALQAFLTLDDGTIQGKFFWEIAGLTSDPRVEYDLCWTANTVGSGATHLITHVLFEA